MENIAYKIVSIMKNRGVGMSNKTSDKNVANIEEKKQINTSLGFSIDLERILNHLVEHETYMAMISNIRIRYIGEKEDTANGKRQVFEIERQVD